MKLVIEIDKDLYEMCRDNLGSEDNIEGIIANGTPLPPHGRLIDADYITKDFNTFQESFVINTDGVKGFKGIACLAPTIIESDKENEE